MAYRLFLFFVISNLVYWSKADISCYECASSNSDYNSYFKGKESVKLCSNFTESDEFEVYCNSSTFCMKKTSELDLPDGGTVRIEERKCAPQTSKEHKLKNGHWVEEKVVVEAVYKEGCYPEQSDLRAAKIEYCYCSSNYCNTAKRSPDTSFFHHTDAMSVIFIFNVVKLMRSVR